MDSVNVSPRSQRRYLHLMDKHPSMGPPDQEHLNDPLTRYSRTLIPSAFILR